MLEIFPYNYIFFILISIVRSILLGRYFLGSLPWDVYTCIHVSTFQPSLTVTAAAATKSLQWCLTLSDPRYCSLPGSSIHGIFQARVLEWGAIGPKCHQNSFKHGFTTINLQILFRGISFWIISRIFSCM